MILKPPCRLVAVAAVLLAASSRASAAQSTDTLRLSLPDAVDRVLRLSDEAKLAQALMDVADAQITTARAAGMPQLRLQGGYTQVLENARAQIVGQVFNQPYNYSSNVNISQPIFQGGRIFAGARAAGDVHSASRYDALETRAQLSVDAQRTYLQALLTRELEGIQARNVQLADERVALVQRLESAGRASRYDLLRSRVERTNLEPPLLQARSSRRLAEIEVRRLLNIPAAQPLVLTSELDTASLRGVVRAVAGDTTADPVRAAERSADMIVSARREGVRIARADLMPTISTFFQTGYVALPGSNGIPTLRGSTNAGNCPPVSTAKVCQNNGWFTDRQFGLTVSWPLFDGLRAKGNIDLAQAQERTARILLAQRREQVASERSRARAEYARAEATFEAQRQNAGEADEAYHIAALRFERGLGTQLEVSDAQLLLLTARTNAARATIDYYLAAAELARARGIAIPLPPTRPSTR